MANENCIPTLRSIGLSCEAKNAIAGVNKRLWLTTLSRIAGTTKDSDGYVNTLTMGQDSSSADYKLITITGRANTHNGAFEGVFGDNVNLIKHNATVKLFADTPEKRDLVKNLLNEDDVVVIYETEAGKVEIYGLETGLEMSALTGGTGTQKQDDFGITATFSGDQSALPDMMLVGGSLSATITYLDAITE
jgi:hypothetical protein